MKRTSQLFLAALLLALFLFGGRRQKAPPAVAISDGTVVLLKSGITNAAFVVTNQSLSPEVLNYTWFFRTDGRGTFDVKDPACVHGVVTNAKGIAFGPFNIGWSYAGGASGYVYYPSRDRWIKKPWGGYWGYQLPKELGGPVMAVTFERDLTKVDANDKRWKFER